MTDAQEPKGHRYKKGNAWAFKPGCRGGPGRPSKMAIWRAEVEADFDDWMQVYIDARDSGNLELAMKAADRVLDRAYGKPKQSVEHSGHVSLDAVLFEDVREALG